jgi:hypothetical protein
MNLIIFRVLLLIFILSINSIVLNWLIKIQKCQCTNIKEGKFIKEWFIFAIIMNIINILILIINGAPIKIENKIMRISYLIFIFAITIINIINIIRLLIYISKLKKINCNCGLSKQQNFIYYYYIILYSIILSILLLALLAFLFIYNK